MSDDARYQLHDSIGYQLSLTSRLQEKRLDEKLKTLGLTRVTWCILLALENEGLFLPSDIAKFVGIDRTATSRALRAMERDGLIARRAGDGDRRTTHVSAKPKGRDLIARATPFARDNSRKIDAKLTTDERETLRRALAKIREGEDIALDHF